MNRFVARTSKPTNELYYIRKSEGGYSEAILGSPKEEVCNTLANCIGYSYGRFNECSNEESCKYLSPVNPGLMIKYSKGLEQGQIPKVGALILWLKNDGSTSGHCGNVEAVLDENTIITSESHYGGSAFDLNIRKSGQNGKFFFKSGYTFKCFIYNPNVIDERTNYDNIVVSCETLKKSVEDKNTEITSLKAKQAEISDKLNDLGDSYSELEVSYQDLQKELDFMKSEYAQLSEKYVDVNSKLLASEKENAQLKQTSTQNIFTLIANLFKKKED